MGRLEHPPARQRPRPPDHPRRSRPRRHRHRYEAEQAGHSALGVGHGAAVEPGWIEATDAVVRGSGPPSLLIFPMPRLPLGDPLHRLLHPRGFRLLALRLADPLAVVTLLAR